MGAVRRSASFPGFRTIKSVACRYGFWIVKRLLFCSPLRYRNIHWMFLHALGTARQGEGVVEKFPSHAAASVFYAPTRRHTILVRAGRDTLLFMVVPFFFRVRWFCVTCFFKV